MNLNNQINSRGQLFAGIAKSICTMTTLAALASLVSCGGSTSTIKEGYAYKISQPQAKKILGDVMHSHASRVSVSMLPSGRIEAKGHDRSIIDTHFYTLSAIPVIEHDAFGFEIKHGGTLFVGPMTAKRILDHAEHQASELGSRLSIR